MALATIRALGIPKGQLYIVWGREYSYPTDKKNIKLPKKIQCLGSIPSYGERWLLFRYWTKVRALDDFLDAISPNTKVSLYLPSTRNFLMQAMATSRKVVALYYIEEGLLSYTGNYTKKTNIKYRGAVGLVKSLCKWSWHFGRSFYYKKELYSPCLFTINADLNSFNNCGVVNFVSPEGLLDEIEYPFLDSSVFVFDALVEFGYCNVESVINIFDIFLRKFSSGKERLIVRFHPVQMIQKKIIEILEKNRINYVVDDGCFPLEIVLMQRRMKIYGFHSSLLFYAEIFGSEAFSLASDLMKVDDTAKEWYKASMPKLFFEKVKSLEIL